MKFLNGKWQKYLLLIPVIFLIANAFYFMHATQEIENTLLMEKYTETINMVDMLAAAVEANDDRYWEDHEQNIVDSVEFTDKLYQVYAGAFKPVDGDLVLISERIVHSAPFDPLVYDEFITAISEQESGRVDVWYGEGTQYSRELHLYFKWMPLYSMPGERYLVVAGVSHYSVTVNVPMWVSAGQWGSMGVTFIINVSLILLLARLGHVYEQRDGDKWRKER